MFAAPKQPPAGPSPATETDPRPLQIAGPHYAVTYHDVTEYVSREFSYRQVTVQNADAVCDLMSLDRAPTERIRTHTPGGTPVLTITPIPAFGPLITDADTARRTIESLSERVWHEHPRAGSHVTDYPYRFDTYTIETMLDYADYLIAHDGQALAISPHVIALTDVLAGTPWLFVADTVPAAWRDASRV